MEATEEAETIVPMRAMLESLATMMQAMLSEQSSALSNFFSSFLRFAQNMGPLASPMVLGKEMCLGVYLVVVLWFPGI